MCKNKKLKRRIVFVEFNRLFMHKSFDWLSDPEIKKLTDTLDITLGKQEQWFQSLPMREDYYIRGIMTDGIPIGAVGIKNITMKQGEYWGYIGEKCFWGQGIGKRMVGEMVQVAQNDYHLETLYLNVLADNKRAIALYKGIGFIIDKNEGKNIRMIYTLT